MVLCRRSATAKDIIISLFPSLSVEVDEEVDEVDEDREVPYVDFAGVEGGPSSM